MADTVPGDPRNLRKSILNVFVLLILIYGFFSGVCAVVVSGHVVEEVLRLVIVAAVISLLVGVCRKIHYSRSPIRDGWPRLAETLLLIIGLPVLTLITAGQIPVGAWKSLEDPPSRIVELVSSSPITLFGGDVYGRGADGRLYAHRCAQDKCVWEQMTEPLPVVDTTSYWSGACGGKIQPARSRLLPLAPASVVSSYSTRYCGPDYAVDYYFIATADGRVWVWSMGGGISEAIASVISTVGAFVAGILSLVLLKVGDNEYESVVAKAQRNEN